MFSSTVRQTSVRFGLVLAPLALALLTLAVAGAASATAVGPDAYGYQGLDADEPAAGAPVYDFQPLTGDFRDVFPTPCDDCVSAGIPITSSNFVYYGSLIPYVYVSSNGFIAFEATAAHGCCAGPGIPSTNVPNGIVAAFWTDLNPAAGGTIRWKTDSSPFRGVFTTIEFLDVPYYNDPATVSFQIRLSGGAQNTIEILYRGAPSIGRVTTVGIESPDGTTGLEFAQGSPGFSQTAVLFGVGPTTTVAFEGAAPQAGWYPAPATANFTCQAPSEVRCAAGYWRLDGAGGWADAASPPTIPHGVHTLEYHSVSTANIAEPIQTATVRVDTQAPSVTSGFACATPGNGDWCRVASATYAGAAADDGVGVASLQCALDETPAPCSGTLDGPIQRELRVTAVDGVGRSTTAVFRLWLDSAPPIVPPFDFECDDDRTVAWCRLAALRYTVSATDTIGVSSLECRIDADAAPCAGVLRAEGAHVFVARAIDAAGNEATRTDALGIDSVPPVSAVDAVGASLARPWYGARVDIVTYAEDTTSGIAGVYADSGSGARPFPVQLGEGMNEVWYWSVDLAGNVEVRRPLRVGLDWTLPTAWITLEGVAGGSQDGIQWFRSGVVATPVAYDALSGIYSTTISDGTQQSGFQLLVTDPGLRRVSVEVRDNAGNLAFESREFGIDIQPPAVPISLRCGTPGTNGWCRGPVEVTALATDQGSGLLSMACTLDAVAVACGSFNVTAPGVHTVSLTAFDVAGNPATNSTFVRIDAEPPYAALHLTGDRGAEIDGVPWFRSIVEVDATVDDAVSGLLFVALTLDGFSVSEPLIVGREGTHFASAFARDNAGGLTSAGVGFGIDLTPPTASLLVTCEDPGASDWCLGEVTVDASAADLGSGLRFVACTVDDQPVACGRILVSQPGRHTIRVDAMDGVGHTVSETTMVKIDLDAPQATIVVDGLGGGVRSGVRWFQTIADLSLIASDGTSGVADAVLDVPGGDPRALAEGRHVVTASVRDAADRETVVSLTLGLDSTAPVAALAVECTQAGLAGWCRGPVHLTATATDAQADPEASGLARVTCAVDGAAVACGSFDVAAPGAHTVSVTAYDLAGNSATNATVVRIDAGPPDLTIALSGDRGATVAGVPWFRGAVVVDALAADGVSGLLDVSVTAGQLTGGGSLVVPGEGRHTARATARDVAGASSEAAADFAIDLTPPSVSLLGGCTDAGDAGWCLEAVTVDASAEDLGAGLASVACSVDDQAVPCGRIVVSQPGLHTIRIVAVDLVGHVASETASVRIDLDAPVATIVLHGPGGGLGAGIRWFHGFAVVSLVASDGTSGLADASLDLPNGDPSVRGEGRHLVTASVRDAAGRETIVTLEFGVDSTPPLAVLDVACAQPGLAGWCRGPARVDIGALDARPASNFNGEASGVGDVRCAVDGLAVDCFEPVWITTPGFHVVDLAVLDVAGNLATASAIVRIDSAPPVVTIASACAAPGNAGWCRGGLSVSFSILEGESGLSASGCEVNGAAVPCGAVAAPGAGVRTLRAWARDGAGNEAAATTTVRLDAIAPSGSVSAPRVAVGAYSVAWSASDFGSGLASVEIQEQRAFGLAGDPWVTVCNVAAAGASASGSCARGTLTGQASYRIVVRDVAGHVFVSESPGVEDANGGACTLGLAAPGVPSVASGLPVALREEDVALLA